MKRPQFTIKDLLHAMAIAGAAITAWKLLDVPFLLEKTKGMASETSEQMAHARAFAQATFLLGGITWGGRLKFKRQYWWWPGAWMGLGIGIAVWFAIVTIPIAIFKLAGL